MSLWLYAGIGALGGLGAVGRFLVDAAVSARLGRGFPWGTLTVNLSGAFVLGLLTEAAVGANALLLFGSGVLGSYTTFSTWMLQSRTLAADGARRAAAINVVASLLAGLAAAAGGRALGMA